MIPFIGLYFYAPELKGTLQRHIYPTPDPRNPFLGVHFTKTAHGDVKVGPTAIPILSREQYGFFEGLKANELLGILANYPRFIGSKHHDVWSLVKTELPKLSRKHLLRQASKLSSKVDVSKFTVPGKPGIRAQLFDKREARLEMDFVIEGDANSTHVLNAVSPGWTSCFSFAEYVVTDMELRQKA
jgi:L-2-hydroxyglutarate oxidase LhgO